MPILIATERMFGNGGCFRYTTCPSCRSVCLHDVPNDLSEHYPSNYYSYTRHECPPMKGVLLFLKRMLSRHYYQRLNPFLIPARLFFPRRLRWLPRGLIGFDEPVLDVGCGAGSNLELMAHEGFTNLTGVDPFVREASTSPRFRILKEDVADHQGSYRLIFSHHVIEHVTEPVEFLRHIERLLAPDGFSIICTPNPVSLAANHYKQFWFGLDAPRHIHLLSPDAMKKAAGQAGLRVERFTSDSVTLQFFGSRSYQKGIKFQDLEGPSGLEKLAQQMLTGALNLLGYGDSARYLLRRA